MKHLFFLLVAFLVSTSLNVQAQEQCTLVFNAIVVDDHNNEPLVGAIISLDGRNVGIANNEGEFRLENLCQGSHQLIISHIDCEDFVTEIDLQKSTTKTFYLEHHTEAIEQIIINYERKAGEVSKASKQLKENELADQQARNFGELLENVEGVTLLKTGTTIAKPVLNGLHSQRVLTINNGIRQEGQQWGQEHAPEIDPYTIQSITVIKGAGSVKFGADGLGGVLVVKPNALPTQHGFKIAPTLAYQSNGQSMLGNLTIEGKETIANLPVSYQAQGSLKKSGNLKTPDYYLNNTGTNEQNFSLRAGYLLDNFGVEAKISQYNTEIGILSDSHIGNKDDLLAIIKNGRPFTDQGFSYDIGRPRQEILHEIAQVSSYKQTNIGEINFEFARQYNTRSEFDRYDNKPGLKLKTETYIGKLSLEHSLLNQITGEIGIESLVQDYRADGFYLIPEYQQFGLGAYFIQNYEVSESLFAEAGFRYDYKTYDYQIPIDALDRINQTGIEYSTIVDGIGEVTNTYNDLLTGSLGLTKNINDDLSIATYLGYGVRQPLPNELFSDGVHHGTAYFEVGNPNLTTEKALTTQLNLNYQSDRGFSATANVYRNAIQDYVYLIPSNNLEPEFTIRGYFPIRETIQNNVTFIGVDYALGQTLDKIQLSTQGSILKADDTDLNTPLFSTPGNRLQHRIQYNWNEHLNTSIDLENVFQQKRIPNEDIIQDYTNAPNGYNLINLSTSYRTKVYKQPLTLRLKVDNLLNKQYKDYTNAFRYYADEIGTNVGISLNYIIK